MLIVKTYIAPSKIHGLGVFAAEPLTRGTLIWVFDPVIDQEITQNQLAMLPEAVRNIAISRSFVGECGRTILSRDNGVFLNHSDHPNLSSGADGSIAVRNISTGEELTEDYRLLPPGACRAFLEDQHLPIGRIHAPIRQFLMAVASRCTRGRLRRSFTGYSTRSNAITRTNTTADGQRFIR
jgi:hypothetical protein